MPTTPHPVNPTRPRPLPGPKPVPTEPKKVVAATEYVGIAACIVSSIAIATLFGRADLLIFVFVMSYLIVSLVTPARRHRRLRIAPAGAAVGGTADGGPH